MKIEVNLSDRFLYTIIAVLFFVAVAVGVYAYTNAIPNPGHGADSVLISIRGQEMTLQEAIDNNLIGQEIEIPEITTSGRFDGLTSIPGKDLSNICKKLNQGWGLLDLNSGCDTFCKNKDAKYIGGVGNQIVCNANPKASCFCFG